MPSRALELHLRQIATFIAVVETRSFRAAADQMNISQSAVTVRVQQIEERLGVPVLHRTTRQVEPTPEGLRFHAAARRVLDEIERVAGELREEAVLQRGQVTIAAMPSVAGTLLPKAMVALAQVHPGLAIRQLDVDSHRILRMTRNGEIDLGLTTELADQSDAEFTPLFFEECVLVVRQDDPEPAGERITLTRSIERPLFASPAGARLRDVIDRAYAEAGIEFRPAQEAWQMLTLERLVAAGLGAAIMPFGPASSLDPARFRLLRFDPGFGRSVGILRGRNRSHSPAARAVHDFLVANVDRLMREAGLGGQPLVDAPSSAASR
jgi:LysR family carnitine catabolism transcriptional activator